MNPIGNGFDRLRVGFEVREKMAPHVIADFAMELADAVFIAR